MFLWFFIVLMPFLAFGFGVYGLVRWINGRFHLGPPAFSPRDKPVPLWATIVLIGLPLVRYGILILGRMGFALAEEDYGSRDAAGFRRWYPDSFAGNTYGFFPDVPVLLDTLFVVALLVCAIRWLQRRASQRRRAAPLLSEQGPDETIWPPPPKPPRG